MPTNPHRKRLKDAVDDFNLRTQALHRRLGLLGINFKITCWYRSNDVQARLYALGRTRPGSKVTGCKPGQSPHQYRLARDYALIIDGTVSWDTRRKEWKQFIQAVRDSGLTTGADFKHIYDAAHTELPDWQAHVQKEGLI